MLKSGRRLLLNQSIKHIRFNSTYSIKSALASFPLTSTSTLPTETAETIIINGWIKSTRKQKNISFLVINDGSNLNGIQIVLNKEVEESCLNLSNQKLSIGSSASVRGKIVESKGKGQAKEFKAEFIEIIGQSDPETYPIQNLKQGVPITILRKNSHLRPRTNSIAAMLRIRSRMAWAAHNYFMGQDFLQVQTPLITSSDCEGAGEVFKVIVDEPASSPATVSIASISALSLTPITPPPTSISNRYLTVSSQLHLEAIASSFSKVYTLSPSFRAEKSDTARHLQEFWMLEAELSFLPKDEKLGLDLVMNVVEGVIKSVVNDLLENNREDLGFFFDQTEGLESQIISIVESSTSSSFPKITYAEAIVLLEAHSNSNPDQFKFKPSWGNSLQTEHEKWLAEDYFKGPVFVTDYPSNQKPFYMLPNPSSSSSSLPDQTTSSCFDLLVPRLGELAGGSLRESQLEPLINSMNLNNIEVENYNWYTDLRRFGSTPHGGFGLGWERLVGFITGLDNVRECIAFPRASEGSRF